MHVFVPSAFPSLLTQRMGAISDVIIASATAGHVDGVVVKLPALVLQYRGRHRGAADISETDHFDV